MFLVPVSLFIAETTAFLPEISNNIKRLKTSYELRSHTKETTVFDLMKKKAALKKELYVGQAQAEYNKELRIKINIIENQIQKILQQ